VPEADLRVGDLQFLPYADDSFELVCGFNSFFFAADMVAALREARRVAKAGATVLVQVWGRPERCDLTAVKAAVGALRDGPPGPTAPELWRPGALEGLATEAGLVPMEAFDVRYSLEVADEQELVRLMLAPGVMVAAAQSFGEHAVRQAIVSSLASFRTPAGAYRLENEWHYLLAAA
jgi:SAM-dependent methyltransferase